jgi:predicted membrane protein
VKKILEIREILSGTLGFPKTLTVNLPQATAGIIIGMVTAMAQAAQSLIAKEMMTTTANLHRVGAIPGVHISQLQRMGEAEERLTEGGEVEEVEEVCLDIDPSKEQKVKRNGSSW